MTPHKEETAVRCFRDSLLIKWALKLYVESLEKVWIWVFYLPTYANFHRLGWWGEPMDIYFWTWLYICVKVKCLNRATLCVKTNREGIVTLDRNMIWMLFKGWPRWGYALRNRESELTGVLIDEELIISNDILWSSLLLDKQNAEILQIKFSSIWSEKSVRDEEWRSAMKYHFINKIRSGFEIVMV